MNIKEAAEAARTRNATANVMTECGKRVDDFDPGHLTVNGHYHYYLNGTCDTEPPYEEGGPA
jgi:hypothetical protein